jgi:acetyl coenzyme A synthetase (ADP forming)-like protein
MLETLFAPRGVAVIGASQTPTKLGYGVARNLVMSGYQGALHFVNPKGGELFGRPMVRDIADIPDPVDLAMIIIPAAAVPGALEACGKRGIRAVIIGSGGFREVGPDGAALEKTCLDIARRYEIRIIGPNCIGFLDTHLPIDTTFLPLPGPIPGDIAFISHSGAICEAAIDWARGQGFGLSRLVSLGNQMDLTEADVLAPTAADPETRVIALYLEGVGDGPTFVRQASLVTKDKPVVAIKVGRSARGRAAVASHTGALAGEEAAFEAALRKAGVLRADTSEALFDSARALAWCPLPKGRRVAVLTNAGGPGAIAADALDAVGLQLSDLSAETEADLAKLHPPAASLRNPVDMLASAGPHEYAQSLRVLLADHQVDSVMVILPPPPVSTAADVAAALIPEIQTSDKPVVLALMGEDLILQAARLFRQARVPEYRFPERAASALRALVDRAERLALPDEPPLKPRLADADAARQRLDSCGITDGFLPPDVCYDLGAAYGLPLPESRLVTSAEAAAEAAGEIGFPVALKVVASGLTHKSDAGGVALGLTDATQVRTAFEEVTTRPKQAAPDAEITGVLVQTMQPPGQEVILGMVRDPQFGPLLMFGSGGIEVEGLRDTAFALPPLTSTELQKMLARTWAGRRLAGYRNLPAGDRQAVADGLVALGQMAVDLPSLMEVEINPLRVFPSNQGASALDVRMRVGPSL